MIRTCVVNLTTNLVVGVIELGGDVPSNCVEDTAAPPGFAWFPHDTAGIGWSSVNGQLVAPPSAPAAVVPNVPGFVDEIKTAVGGIVASNALATKYPLFYPALQKSNFPDAQALIVDAKATGALTTAQYAAFQSLSEKYNVPLTLP